MNDLTRRRLEMARRVVEFSRAHPDTNPAYLALLARLETLLARAEALEQQEKIEAEELRRIQSGSDGEIPLDRPSDN
jgi:7,8-dihydro-6-hydroxymethylpterin-pyrophosphokinase